MREEGEKDARRGGVKEGSCLHRFSFSRDAIRTSVRSYSPPEVSGPPAASSARTASASREDDEESIVVRRWRSISFRGRKKSPSRGRGARPITRTGRRRGRKSSSAQPFASFSSSCKWREGNLIVGKSRTN